MSTEGADEPTGSEEDGTGGEAEPEVRHGGSKVRRRSLLLVAGVVLVVVAAVAAGMIVFGGDESDGSRAAEGHVSTLEPLALSDDPLWTADRLAGRTMVASPAITVRDDVALLRSFDEFSVLDMATGQVRWSVDPLPESAWAELPGLDGAAWLPSLDGPLLRSHDGEPAVLTDYWNPPETGGSKGVALLSAETGEVLWRRDVPDLAGLGAADDHTALVATTPGGYGLGADDLGSLKTLAIDMGTGEKLWEQTGVWPDAVSGDVALGHRSLERHPSPSEETTVVALDLGTGAQKWDLSERFVRSRLVQTAGDVALVAGSLSRDFDGSTMDVVATDSGKPLHDISGESCYTDGRTLVSCVTPSGKLSDLDTFDIPEHTMKESRASFIGVTTVGRNRLFLEDVGGGATRSTPPVPRSTRNYPVWSSRSLTATRCSTSPMRSAPRCTG
jgi:outer membrane protein assembly factor BamB